MSRPKVKGQVHQGQKTRLAAVSYTKAYRDGMEQADSSECVCAWTCSMRPLIYSPLRRLNGTPANNAAILDACTWEQDRLTRNCFRLPLNVKDSTEIIVCAPSIKLLWRCQPALLNTHTSVYTWGRQLPISCYISLRLYGYEDAHRALWLLAALEIGLHPATYSPDSSTRRDLLNHQLIVCRLSVTLSENWRQTVPTAASLLWSPSALRWAWSATVCILQICPTSQVRSWQQSEGEQTAPTGLFLYSQRTMCLLLVTSTLITSFHRSQNTSFRIQQLPLTRSKIVVHWLYFCSGRQSIQTTVVYTLLCKKQTLE